MIPEKRNRRDGGAGPWKGGRIVTSLASGALVVALTCLVATGDGGIDDEMVGTLPMMHDGPALDPSAAPKSTDFAPAFFLSGPLERIQRGVVDAGGCAPIVLSGDDPRLATVVFRGSVSLDLDASLFLDPAIRAGLAVGAEPGPVALALGYRERVVGLTHVAPHGRLALPLGLYERRGVLAEGIDLFTATEGGAYGRLRIREVPGVVMVRQVAYGR